MEVEVLKEVDKVNRLSINEREKIIRKWIHFLFNNGYSTTTKGLKATNKLSNLVKNVMPFIKSMFDEEADDLPTLFALEMSRRILLHTTNQLMPKEFVELTATLRGYLSAIVQLKEES